MNLKTILPGLMILALACAARAQGSGLPLGNDGYHILDRLHIKTGVEAPFHPALKSFTRGDVARFAMAMDTVRDRLSVFDLIDLEYLYKDNNEWLGQAPWATTLGGRRERMWPDTALTQIEWSLRDPRYYRRQKPLLGIFYPTPANMLEVNEKHFHLRVNPLLNINYSFAADEDQPVFINQRGVELRGGIDDRIYFYFNILEL